MEDVSIDLDIQYHVEAAVDDSDRFARAAKWIAEELEVSSLSASVAIVDDPTIHALNREHLQHDWPTDVISFVHEKESGCVVGEIIASIDTARKLFPDAGWRLEDELLLYVVHGLLHLAGLDDLNEEDCQQMRESEQACLMHLDVPGAEEHLSRWDDVSY